MAILLSFAIPLTVEDFRPVSNRPLTSSKATVTADRRLSALLGLKSYRRSTMKTLQYVYVHNILLQQAGLRILCYT